MDRAVTVEVTCIDSEYGFTMLNVKNNFTGERLATLTIRHEQFYDDQDNAVDVVHVEAVESPARITLGRGF